MAIEVLDYKICPECGWPLDWNVLLGSWYCFLCKKKYKAKELELVMAEKNSKVDVGQIKVNLNGSYITPACPYCKHVSMEYSAAYNRYECATCGKKYSMEDMHDLHSGYWVKELAHFKKCLICQMEFSKGHSHTCLPPQEHLKKIGKGEAVETPILKSLSYPLNFVVSKEALKEEIKDHKFSIQVQPPSTEELLTKLLQELQLNTALVDELRHAQIKTNKYLEKLIDLWMPKV